MTILMFLFGFFIFFVGVIVIIMIIFRISHITDIENDLNKRQINDICYSCPAFPDCGGGTDCETIRNKEDKQMIVIKNIKNSLYAHINWSTKKIEYKSFPMLTDNNWEDISQMWNGNLEQTKEYVLSNIRNHPDYNDLKLIRIWFYEESQPIDWDKLISLIKQADVYLRINAPILAERIRNILTQLELRSIPKEQPIDLDDERLDKVLSDCGVKPGYLKEYRLLFKDVISRLSLSIPKEQSFMKNKDNTDSDYDQ